MGAMPYAVRNPGMGVFDVLFTGHTATPVIKTTSDLSRFIPAPSQHSCCRWPDQFPTVAGQCCGALGFGALSDLDKLDHRWSSLSKPIWTSSTTGSSLHGWVRGGECQPARAEMRALAVEMLDCGFWPVIRVPSTTTLSDHAAPVSSTPPASLREASTENGIWSR